MFTGLVQELVPVARLVAETSGVRLVLDSPDLARRSAVGDSVAINGCCLTVVEHDEKTVSCQAGPETLSRTNVGKLHAGTLVNVETPLRAGEPLGGHFVTGHIDGTGQLLSREDHGGFVTCWFSAPPELLLQMAAKGSVAVDGVSLTLVEVLTDRFSVQLIPHTLSVTTLGRLAIGDAVNLETDVLAKYVQRLVDGRISPSDSLPF
jgi:riboflavin synthase